ncbi:MAG: hypothetical protein O3B13_22115 [Planctomycetota bacterium]|nr:hypothetical protein [Planctomycetota bacterium]
MSLFPRMMAIVPFGVGMTVLIGLWGGGMGNPPIFFRVFGSFVALAFVMTGIGIFTAAGKIGDPNRMAQSLQEIAKGLSTNLPVTDSAPDTADDVRQTVGYDCPKCGAALGKEAEVSPSGDVKCGYCDRWFNIHQHG